MAQQITFVIPLVLATPAYAQRAVILVRHAEKEAGSGDVRLSATGKKRAYELARVLKDAGVDDIFTTTALRTKQTAEPLATAMKRNSQQFDANEKTEVMAERLRTKNADQVVLIVGHSNTIPAIIDAIMKRPVGITIGDTEFDHMFILISKQNGAWSLVRSRY